MLDPDHYQKIVFLTGAGVSVASGIPPFRGPGGFWNDQEIERCATAEALERDPELVWRAFAPLREAARKARPNAAHRIMAELESRHPQVHLLTQNVDGLHLAAGSRRVVELHGNIHRTRCTRCESPAFTDESLDFRACPQCGAALRFDIVLFHEMLDPEALRLTAEALRGVDLFVAVGTSGTVYPAAGFAASAQADGAWLVLVNLEPAPGGWYDQQVVGRAEEVLPGLFKRPEAS